MIKFTHDGAVVEAPLTEDSILDLKRLFPAEVVDNAVSVSRLNLTHNLRREAYKNESDPLYMEWQYDNTPESEQAWRDKVDEIKNRYPLPSES
ncbi:MULTISPECIES: hypothetical protein [unclassified Pseudoalteromonas]|uniref:hypothetical protein n=1 Tax=unclassified Pseudoalteromonas TaxID=194690 RepID=UPI001F242AB8|nr:MULTISPECIES: hypothetical protein [unclassified Pseudoalteromonas]MCF2827065.1 hypothetical protein [Pseudoalteromonas sp. OF5H-5]MCF2832027.1 hypothetical protein [Pseudoalteromonas sp. DL2-H6]MCF2925922.1 hypothetical protein [Pseudoalteromonas sp. DL2-H1]